MSPVSRTRKPCTRWVIGSCRRDTDFLQNGLACVPAETAKETRETGLKGNGEREDSMVKKRGENCPLAHCRKFEVKLWVENLSWRCPLRLM